MGRSIPFRKLLQMISYRSIRDPSREDALAESSFANLGADSTSIGSMPGFLDNMLKLLGSARVDLFSAGRVEEKILGELRRCGNAIVRKDILS